MLNPGAKEFCVTQDTPTPLSTKGETEDKDSGIEIIVGPKCQVTPDISNSRHVTHDMTEPPRPTSPTQEILYDAPEIETIPVQNSDHNSTTAAVEHTASNRPKRSRKFTEPLQVDPKKKSYRS